MSPNTENIEARLSAYIDGELDAAGRAEIERHLAENPQHRALIVDLMRQRDLLRAMPVESAPEDLREAIEQQIERSMLLGGTDDAASTVIKIRRWPQVFSVAAIVLLTVGLGVVVYQVVTPPEPHMQLTMVAPTTAPVPLVTDETEAAAPEAMAFKADLAKAALARAETVRRVEPRERARELDGPAIALPTPGELLDARNQAANDATTAPVDAIPSTAVAAAVPEEPALSSVAAVLGESSAPAAVAPEILASAFGIASGSGGVSVDKTWVEGVLGRAGFVNRSATEPVVVVLNATDFGAAEQRVRDVLASSNLQFDLAPQAEPVPSIALARDELATKSKDAEDQQSILLRQNYQLQSPYAGAERRAPAVNYDAQVNTASKAIAPVVKEEDTEKFARQNTIVDDNRIYVVRNVPAKQARDVADELARLDAPAALSVSKTTGWASKESKVGGLEAQLSSDKDTDTKKSSNATTLPAPSNEMVVSVPLADALAQLPATLPGTLPADAPPVDLVIVLQIAGATPASAPTSAPTTEPATTQPAVVP